MDHMVVHGLDCIPESRASVLPVIWDTWLSSTCLLRQECLRWILHLYYGAWTGICGTASGSWSSRLLFRPLHMATWASLQHGIQDKFFPWELTSFWVQESQVSIVKLFSSSLWRHSHHMLLIKQCDKTSWNSRRVSIKWHKHNTLA